MAVTLALAGLVALRFGAGGALNADLISLLPADDRNPILDSAAKEMRNSFERRLVLLVGAENQETVLNVAQQVRDALDDQPALTPDRAAGGLPNRREFSFYAKHRHGLVDESMRQALLSGDAARVTSIIVRRYTDPAAVVNSEIIKADPLLLLPTFLEEAWPSSPDNMYLVEGHALFEREGRFYAPLFYEISGSPFSFDVQNAVVTALAESQSVVTHAGADVTLWSAGVVRHAARGTQTARAEISTVGLGSLVGIIVLVLFVFRSGALLFASMLSIGVGVTAGVAACLFLFSEVHLLTLVFGGSLVGISVDYVFHYFCERARPDKDVTGEEALFHIFPGITLGLVTTLIGFAGLWIAPFPGLRQMAVFSGAGLAASYLTVCLWFPLLSRRSRPMAAAPYRWVQHCLAFWRTLPRLPLVIFFGLVAGLSLLGINRLEPLDDVRLFQSIDKRLLAEQMRIEKVLGQSAASQFFLVVARTSEEMLRREETLRARLGQADYDDIGALSRFLPSKAQQAENRALLDTFLREGTAPAALAERVGLVPQILGDYRRSLQAAPPPVGLEPWLAEPVSAPYRYLYLGEQDGIHRSAVTLRTVRDIEELERLADGLEGVHLVDTVGTYSSLFRQYREQAIILALLSYILVSVLLFWRYGASGAVAIMAAPFGAALVSLGALGLVGSPFSLFNIMALLLVLGIGVDYGIFFREAGAHSATTLLAVILSALTTLLAFGLLAFSGTAAIHAFGITIFIGITIALLISPFAGVGASGARVGGKIE